MASGEGRRGALAVMAAVSGTGYASGRELVVFFGQLGRAAWPGIAIASAAFGLGMGLLCARARRLGAGSFDALCRLQLGRRALGVVRSLRALLLAAVCALALFIAGRMGMLTLPARHGFAIGAAAALALAALANLSRLRALPWAGGLALGVAVALYLGLALDPRPVRLYLRGDTALALEGSLPAAALLALAYAALNVAVAAGPAVRFGREGVRPFAFGGLCAGMLAAVLACANGALLRGGRALLGQALPMVALTARWGLAGFWLECAFGFLCAACTLSAALGGLLERFGRC